MAKVVVIGAGVSGLSVAYALLELYGNQIKDLTIVGKETPGSFHAHDYTSPWAGANWESFARCEDHAQIQRDRITYERFTKLAAERPESGVKEYKLKMITKKSSETPWFVQEKFVRDLETITDDELRYRNLDPTEYTGFQFTTFTVTPSTYKFWLIGEIKKLGGKIRQVPKIDVIEDIPILMGYVPDLIINATGLGAGKILKNYEPQEVKKVFPLKGQIVQIYEDMPFQIIIDDLPKDDQPLSYQFLNMFPRGDGGCIIGGIAKKNDWSNTVDPELSKRIVAICQRHTPELKTATVYHSYVALRPGREGGVRVEYSEFNLPKQQGKLKVVHNYGIAGAGYQASYGLALEACLLATQVLGPPTGSGRTGCPAKL